MFAGITKATITTMRFIQQDLISVIYVLLNRLVIRISSELIILMFSLEAFSTHWWPLCLFVSQLIISLDYMWICWTIARCVEKVMLDDAIKINLFLERKKWNWSEEKTIQFREANEIHLFWGQFMQFFLFLFCLSDKKAERLK